MTNPSISSIRPATSRERARLGLALFGELPVDVTDDGRICLDRFDSGAATVEFRAVVVIGRGLARRSR